MKLANYGQTAKKMEEAAYGMGEPLFQFNFSVKAKSGFPDSSNTAFFLVGDRGN